VRAVREAVARAPSREPLAVARPSGTRRDSSPTSRRVEGTHDMPRATRTRAAPTGSTPELRAKALVVHERLCAAHGCPVAFFHDFDPLSELVSSLLSHRTKNTDSGRAFRALRARFPSWDAVRDAPTADVEAAIAAVTWPEQKAPRLQAVLREITERRGALADDALDFLGALPVPEARAWLESITGVGPKTSAAVLLFSRLRRPALPVDSHHHRVAERLALLPPGVPVGPAHAILAAQLPPDWDAQTVYDNHEALMLHGQRVCHYRDPACERCVVLDLCPTGQARMSRLGDRDPERSLPPRRANANPTTGDDDMPNDLPKGLDARGGGEQPKDADRPPQSAAQRAHGTHGKGGSEELLDDPQATDTGDDAQLRRAGGRDEPPSPDKFRDNAVGRMGGAGWGSEQVGGSTVDRRPPDPDTGDDRRHA
jgi:endonuclease-3